MPTAGAEVPIQRVPRGLPGPGNPLGTRWIGTSAPAVGIHGTPADYTIGSRASHGCIRMHIPDVEKLYEQVTVGMEVDIDA
ncbi:MAG: L,D-transpeptidase ErfK/SrfK [Miltoncostaeaceae bacterium]|nr:L,D-transpeptidase ErfK/SrfK [Miltoncostaeaceae bacterium]